MKIKRSKYIKVVQGASYIKDTITNKSKRAWKKLLAVVDKKPLTSFFALLGLLLVFIVAGNFLRKPKIDSRVQTPPPKAVHVYSIGENPRVQVSAKVEKSGVVTLVAQTSGIVMGIHKLEGFSVNKGESIFFIASNYQGGSMSSVTRQIAQKNLDFVESSYEIQKQMIDKRRELANAGDSQADDLRNITHQSEDETRRLITLNEEILVSIDAQIADLEATNVGGANDALILQAKQGKAGVLTGLNALRSGLRSIEYQASSEQEPAQISNVSRELTNQQLDIEKKSLDLNREITRLNAKIATISESFNFPSSPFQGVIQRVYVSIGDSVNPGTPLATIKSNTTISNLVALVSGDFAKSIAIMEKSHITVGHESLELSPRFVSSEPTDGLLHSVVFTVPLEKGELFTNDSYVVIDIPVAKPKSSGSVPFVPLDAVFQTQKNAYVFVASTSGSPRLVATSKTILLGDVVGSFVEILSGLAPGDQVIIDRTVISGDEVVLQ